MKASSIVPIKAEDFRPVETASPRVRDGVVDKDYDLLHHDATKTMHRMSTKVGCGLEFVSTTADRVPSIYEDLVHEMVVHWRLRYCYLILSVVVYFWTYLAQFGFREWFGDYSISMMVGLTLGCISYGLYAFVVISETKVQMGIKIRYVVGWGTGATLLGCFALLVYNPAEHSYALSCLVVGLTGSIPAFFTHLWIVPVRNSESTVVRAVASGLSASIAFAVILVSSSYSVVSYTVNGFWGELLTTGVMFPFLTVIIGRVLVADYVAFAYLQFIEKDRDLGVVTNCLAEDPDARVRMLMACFAKLSLHLAGQIVLVMLSNNNAFYGALVVSNVSEVVGAYGTVWFMQILLDRSIELMCGSRKVENTGGRLDDTTCNSANSNSVERKKTFLEIWNDDRRHMKTEKLILNYAIEEIAEDVVGWSACIVALSIHSMRGTLNENVLFRCVLLLLTEVLVDIVKKRILIIAGRQTGKPIVISNVNIGIDSAITLCTIFGTLSSYMFVYSGECVFCAICDQQKDLSCANVCGYVVP